MKFVLSATALAALTASTQAQLTYISGIQTNTGYVRNIEFSADASDSYNEAAPSATNSWNPAPRNITAQAGPGTGMGHLETSWSSTLDPGHLAWHAATPSARAVPNAGAAESTFRYDKNFDITFHVSSPTMVSVSALIDRNNGGWTTGAPFSMSFGPVGGPAFFSLASNPSSPFDYTGSFPTTVLNLAPGDYRVTALNHADWSGGRHGANDASDDMVFDLTVVPAPGSLAVLAAGALGATRRRRR